MEINLFYDVMPCSLFVINVLEEPTRYLFSSDLNIAGIGFFKNIDNDLLYGIRF
jgi:hypothetical protein